MFVDRCSIAVRYMFDMSLDFRWVSFGCHWAWHVRWIVDRCPLGQVKLAVDGCSLTFAVFLSLGFTLFHLIFFEPPFPELLSNHTVESFGDALWLGVWSLLLLFLLWFFQVCTVTTPCTHTGRQVWRICCRIPVLPLPTNNERHADM